MGFHVCAQALTLTVNGEDEISANEKRRVISKKSSRVGVNDLTRLPMLRLPLVCVLQQEIYFVTFARLSSLCCATRTSTGEGQDYFDSEFLALMTYLLDGNYKKDSDVSCWGPSIYALHHYLVCSNC